MKKYDFKEKWTYENGFYLTSDFNRIPKMIAHYELYKKITNLPGHLLEFGVYKGVSFVQWLTFREMLESPASRKMFGFDAFGKFPTKNIKAKTDKVFVERFEKEGGDGLKKNQIKGHLEQKGFNNFELIEGDILQTLPHFLETNPQYRFSLIHIDVDVYEPSVEILKLLESKMVRGGLIVLDDYNTVEGETRAVDEFLNEAFERIQKLPISHIPCYIQKK